MAIHRKSKTWIFLTALLLGVLLVNVLLIYFAPKNSYIDTISYAWAILVPVLVIVIPRGILCSRLICRLKKKPPMRHILLSYVPAFNVTFIMRTINEDKAVGHSIATGYIYGVAILSTIARIVFSQSVLVVLISSLVIYTAVFVYVVQDWVFNWYMCGMLDKNKDKIWAILMPPVCSYLLSNSVVPYFIKNKDALEGTFGD